MTQRPDPKTLIGQNTQDVPMSCQRVLKAGTKAESVWIGPDDAAKLNKEETEAYESAKTIISHMAIEMPRSHKSGHPGGPLSAFTAAYWVMKLRDPSIDQPLRMSPGHLSILSYTLQYLFGRSGDDERLSSPYKLTETFRTPNGLPGHIEAGIGDIPFGTGPLGKGVSNALGTAFGLKHQKKSGIVDVILADGDAEEGQVPEAFRLAAHLKVDNLIVHGDWNDMQLSGLPTEVVSADFSAMARAYGWQVIEVQNGNDPTQVKSAIKKANEFIGKDRPIFICYYTTMGSGIPIMEEGSNTGKKNYHGAPLSDEEAANALKSIPNLDDAVKTYAKHLKNEKKRYESKLQTYTDIKLELKLKGYKRTITTEKGAVRTDFGATHILNLMKADERIIVLHADLAGSGGFTKVEKEFPNRVINVGVAEANMAMMAAGMRQTGLLPVTYTFATFGTNEARANARLIDINCGHTRCGVIHDCTHSGLSVGEDGETHQERNYLNIPFDNTQVWMPGDSNQAGAMAERAREMICEGHTSIYIFSARSGHNQILDDKGKPVYDEKYVFNGRATMLRGTGNSTDKATIIASGITVHEAIKAVDELTLPTSRQASHESQIDRPLSIRVLNVACIRPLDSSAIIQAALETEHLIVVEDHNSEGGLATQIADVIADLQLPCSLRRLGANHYFPSAPAKDLFLMAGIDSESIADAVQDEIRIEVCGGEDVFTSCIHSLTHNLAHSRFKESAADFVTRLKEESGYLETLRQEWTERACPLEKIPNNEELKESL